MSFPGYAAPQAFVVDAGVLMVGSNVIGATRGGLKFDPGITYRHVEFDGKTSDIEQLHRITEYNSTISGKMKDLTDAAISRYFPGATSDGSSNNLFTMKSARAFLGSGDYLSNVKLVASQSDGETIVVTFAKALVEKVSFTTQDKDEADVEISIRAVLASSAALEAPPFTITKAAS